jgi:quinoprotein glucose dehydrogenase
MRRSSLRASIRAVSTSIRPSAFRHLILILLLAIPGGLTLIGGQQPYIPQALPQLVQLPAADATRLAAEGRKGVNVTMPAGLELSLFAPDGLLVDPVTLEFDEAGTLYVASTSRANMPLDIRGHSTWVPSVHSLKTVPDLLAFYKKELAPERSKQNDWIPDANKDGVRDIRDFAEFKERLYRIQDTNGDGVADTSKIMIEGFNADPTYDVVGALLYNQGDLLFGIAPGIFRLKDDNGDGTIDRQITLSEGYSTHPAFGGHGISGLIMGPDGRIYWEVGDIGLDVTDKSGKRWSYPNQGAIMRADPDGSNFEIFAAGIRNLQEFSFDEYGNLISVDNDGDHAGESERVVYITNGSDSGWRSNWQYGKYTDPKNNRYNVWMDEGLHKPRFDGQAAYIVPPIASYHAGPSGMVYNPGTALSEEWRNTFFVTSFPGAPANAIVYAFKLKENGAGFSLDSDKELLKGILSIGLKFGPDGALYVTDWINGWTAKGKGRVWKLDAPQAAANPMRAEVRKLIAEKFDGKSASDLSTLLRHADMRIRQKAQFELVKRSDVQTLGAAAREATTKLGRIHGIWGVAQLARKDSQHAAMLARLLSDQDSEVRAQAAKMLGDIRYTQAGAALMPLLKDATPRVRFFAAEALGRIAHKAATPAIVEMLAAADDKDPLLRHAGSLALSRIGDTSAIAALTSHKSKAVRLAAVVALRRMRSGEVGKFFADQDEDVVAEAARAANDDGSIAGALPALAGVLNEKRVTRETIVRRSISANLKLGSGEAVTRLTTFAADTARPEPMRVEAVAALGVWPEPSTMDRVDGMWLEQAAAQRDGEAARAAVLKLLQSVPASGAAPVKVALAEAAARLKIDAAVPVLVAQFRGDASEEVRVAALRALQALEAPGIGDLMKTAVADSSANVRRAALGILPSLKLTEAEKVQNLSTIVRSGQAPDQQAAFEVLGTLKSSEAQAALGSFFDEIGAGKIPPAVQIDLVDAMQATRSEALDAKLEAYRKSKSADTLADAFKDALLVGGNPRRGRDVFVEHAAAQCMRCHAVGDSGGPQVGPNMQGVATRLTRDQLLESLLKPNARIAPGYGTVSVTLKNGQKVDGTLREETATHLVMIAGTPPEERRIAKEEIAQRSDPVSAMPPMGLILKPREIRDLLAALSTLK